MQMFGRLIKGLISMGSILLVIFMGICFIKSLYHVNVSPVFLYLSLFLWPYALAIIKDQDEERVFSPDNVIASSVSIAIVAATDSILKDPNFAQIISMVLFSCLPFYKITITSSKKKTKIEG